jgi:hypothetical protein
MRGTGGAGAETGGPAKGDYDYDYEHAHER